MTREQTRRHLWLLRCCALTLQVRSTSWQMCHRVETAWDAAAVSPVVGTRGDRWVVLVRGRTRGKKVLCCRGSRCRSFWVRGGDEVALPSLLSGAWYTRSDTCLLPQRSRPAIPLPLERCLRGRGFCASTELSLAEESVRTARRGSRPLLERS